MTRVQNDIAMAGGKAVLDMVGHLLRPEEQRQLFEMAVAAFEAALIRYDEMLAWERKRLCKPSDN